MNEIEEMRELFETCERNLTRFRWVITHPHQARNAIDRAILSTAKDQPHAKLVCQEIDAEMAKK